MSRVDWRLGFPPVLDILGPAEGWSKSYGTTPQPMRRSETEQAVNRSLDKCFTRSRVMPQWITVQSKTRTKAIE